jgi:hypothetical protein
VSWADELDVLGSTRPARGVVAPWTPRMEVPIVTERSASTSRFRIPDSPSRDRLLLGLIALVVLVLAL